MSWRELLAENTQLVLPWFGARRVHNAKRTWTLRGPLPSEHGWYAFDVTGGRYATLVEDVIYESDPDYENGHKLLRGYVVGDRFIEDSVRIDPNPNKLFEQTARIQCVERGLERFTRAIVIRDREQSLIFIRQDFPTGPEEVVELAYQERRDSIYDIPGVTPALDLTFRWITHQRKLAEERRLELERIRAEEEKKRAEQERIQRAMRDAGTAMGRRALATRDFEMAAKEALRVSGAELLDCRDSYNRGEMVVQYRFRQRRLECVVEKDTLRVIDAGVCLQDHATGEKGDTYFTLESLPGVIGEAIDLDKLVVWRHVDD